MTATKERGINGPVVRDIGLCSGSVYVHVSEDIASRIAGRCRICDELLDVSTHSRWKLSLSNFGSYLNIRFIRERVLK